MIAILALVAFGIIFTSGEDFHQMPICAEFSDCNSHFGNDPDLKQMMDPEPKIMQKSDFYKFCQTTKNFYDCFKSKNPTALCFADNSVKTFFMKFMMCQESQREFFAENIDCMLILFKNETFAMKNCASNLMTILLHIEANFGLNSSRYEPMCSSINAYYECERDPIVRACGTPTYNALLNSARPEFSARNGWDVGSDCKLTVTKATGGIAKVTGSFIILCIGLVFAKFL